jgi:hypothetical protein
MYIHFFRNAQKNAAERASKNIEDEDDGDKAEEGSERIPKKIPDVLRLHVLRWAMCNGGCYSVVIKK